jgi:ABC-type phosphate transport system substrate-binding protein
MEHRPRRPHTAPVYITALLLLLWGTRCSPFSSALDGAVVSLPPFGAFNKIVAAAWGDQLYGTGASSVAGLFSVWGTQYPYDQDSVTITYASAASADVAVQNFQLGLVDFMSFESPLNDSLLTQLDALQLPVVGGGIVVAYNLNGSLATSAVLNLDGATLAAIWVGNITSWNDPRIAALNSATVAASLPNTAIHLILPTSSSLSLSSVFARALSNFSSDFATELTAAGGALSSLPYVQSSATIATNASLVSSLVRVRAHP